MSEYWLWLLPAVLFWVSRLSPAAKWAYGSALLVFIGVVIESIADLTTWIKPESLKKLAEKVGALILILGLAGDLISVGMAQIEAGELNQKAEDARERAAKLEQKAAELSKEVETEKSARVQLQASVAWRRLSREQQATIADHFKRFARPKVVVSYLECQGRSKTRPLGRSKSRPVEHVEDLRFVGEEGVWSEGLRRL